MRASMTEGSETQMKLLKHIKTFFANPTSDRYRDKRAWYASELTKDARDIYWRATGEQGKQPDLLGSMRMGLGNAIEAYIVNDVIAKAHFFGLHVLGTQTTIGSSAPVNVDGRLDALLVEREGDTFGTPYVLEIKSKWGYGASLVAANHEPSTDHLAQLGYYLRDLSSKGVTSEGILLYVPFADKAFGDLVAVYCKYDSATDTVRAYGSQSVYEEEMREMDISLQIQPLLDRMKTIEGYIERKELPPAESQYKYALTPEFLDSVSDSQLRAAAKNERVLGDWAILYSDFKELHVKHQGGVFGYTQAELDILNRELAKRFPNGAASKALKLKAAG